MQEQEPKAGDTRHSSNQPLIETIGARAENSTTLHVENSVPTRLPSTASTRRNASELRSSTATSAPMPHDCCTAFRKRSRYSSSRLGPSRLVYSQRLFVEIRSDWRRRTVEKPLDSN